MEKLSDINLQHLSVKIGDIKVDSEEIMRLFEIIDVYHGILCNTLDTLTEEERKTLEMGLSYTEYMQNKYLVLGHLRQSQKQMYDILQKLKDKSITESCEPGEVERLRSEAWELYLNDKQKREKLQNEVDRKRREFF